MQSVWSLRIVSRSWGETKTTSVIRRAQRIGGEAGAEPRCSARVAVGRRHPEVLALDRTPRRAARCARPPQPSKQGICRSGSRDRLRAGTVLLHGRRSGTPAAKVGAAARRPASSVRRWSFHPCGIGLSSVSKGRVPNWKAIAPSSGLSIQLSHSRKNHTPPAITIGTLSGSPSVRIISRSTFTRDRDLPASWGLPAFESPLCPPASHGSS